MIHKYSFKLVIGLLLITAFTQNEAKSQSRALSIGGSFSGLVMKGNFTGESFINPKLRVTPQPGYVYALQVEKGVGSGFSIISSIGLASYGTRFTTASHYQGSKRGQSFHNSIIMYRGILASARVGKTVSIGSSLSRLKLKFEGGMDYIFNPLHELGTNFSSSGLDPYTQNNINISAENILSKKYRFGIFSAVGIQHTFGPSLKMCLLFQNSIGLSNVFHWKVKSDFGETLKDGSEVKYENDFKSKLNYIGLQFQIHYVMNSKLKEINL